MNKKNKKNMSENIKKKNCKNKLIQFQIFKLNKRKHKNNKINAMIYNNLIYLDLMIVNTQFNKTKLINQLSYRIYNMQNNYENKLKLIKRKNQLINL